jgi:hypothetical protein
MKNQVIAIVDSDGPANVGDLLVFLCSVGGVAVGYRPRLAVSERFSQESTRKPDHVLRAHFSTIGGGFG